MSSVDDAIKNFEGKITREKALLDAAKRMRDVHKDPGAIARATAQIKDATRNLEYFQSQVHDLKVRQAGSGMDNMSLQPGGPASRKAGNPLTPPPKDGWNGYVGQDQGGYGDSQGGYSNLSGGQGLMPPRAPYGQVPPGTQPKRPNYSKLGKLPSGLRWRIATDMC